MSAQGYQFFAAGFETTASTIAYTLYELCLNTEIQGILREEIKTNLTKHNALTYEGIQEMKYLDMCIMGMYCSILLQLIKSKKNILKSWKTLRTILKVWKIGNSEKFEFSKKIRLKNIFTDTFLRKRHFVSNNVSF